MRQTDWTGPEASPCDEEQKFIAELTGHADLSLKREALDLCRRFLRRSPVSAEGFHEVVRVIGMFGSKSRWAPRLETSFARQSARVRRTLQGTMLTFYAGFDDWENALRYASTRRDLLPHEIAFSIEAFARAGRIREVRRLGNRVDRWIDQIVLNHPVSEGSFFALGFLLYGLGFCHAHQYGVEDPWLLESGRQEAVRSWSCVCIDHPLGTAAAHNASDMILYMALEKMNGWIHDFEQMNSRRFDSTALSLPGNQEGLAAETLARLNRGRRILERLVPANRQRELGVTKTLTDA